MDCPESLNIGTEVLNNQGVDLQYVVGGVRTDLKHLKSIAFQ